MGVMSIFWVFLHPSLHFLKQFDIALQFHIFHTRRAILGAFLVPPAKRRREDEDEDAPLGASFSSSSFPPCID